MHVTLYVPWYVSIYVKSSTPKKIYTHSHWERNKQPHSTSVSILCSLSLSTVGRCLAEHKNLIVFFLSSILIVFFLTSCSFFSTSFRTHFSYRMVHVIAMEVLPEERDRKYYADSYSCCPPPLFILLITIIEVRFYQFRIIILHHRFQTMATQNVIKHYCSVSNHVNWFNIFHSKRYQKRHSPEEEKKHSQWHKYHFTIADCWMKRLWKIQANMHNEMISFWENEYNFWLFFLNTHREAQKKHFYFKT